MHATRPSGRAPIPTGEAPRRADPGRGRPRTPRGPFVFQMRSGSEIGVGLSRIPSMQEARRPVPHRRAKSEPPRPARRSTPSGGGRRRLRCGHARHAWVSRFRGSEQDSRPCAMKTSARDHRTARSHDAARQDKRSGSGRVRFPQYHRLVKLGCESCKRLVTPA